MAMIHKLTLDRLFIDLKELFDGFFNSIKIGNENSYLECIGNIEDYLDKLWNGDEPFDSWNSEEYKYRNEKIYELSIYLRETYFSNILIEPEDRDKDKYPDTADFLTLKKYVQHLKELFEYRIENEDYDLETTSKKLDAPLNEVAVKSAHEAGFYDIFNPLNTSQSNIRLAITPTQFAELITALHKAQAFKTVDGKELHRKDLIKVFENTFNCEYPTFEQTLSQLKKRQKEKSPFLLELAKEFERYCDQ